MLRVSNIRLSKYTSIKRNMCKNNYIQLALLSIDLLNLETKNKDYE